MTYSRGSFYILPSISAGTYFLSGLPVNFEYVAKLKKLAQKWRSNVRYKCHKYERVHAIIGVRNRHQFVCTKCGEEITYYKQKMTRYDSKFWNHRSPCFKRGVKQPIGHYQNTYNQKLKDIRSQMEAAYALYDTKIV